MDGRASLKYDVSLQSFKSTSAVRENIPWSGGLDATHDGAHGHPVTMIRGEYPQRMCQPCGQISSSELGVCRRPNGFEAGLPRPGDVRQCLNGGICHQTQPTGTMALIVLVLSV